MRIKGKAAVFMEPTKMFNFSRTLGTKLNINFEINIGKLQHSWIKKEAECIWVKG